MGGKNVIMIMDDAQLELAVEGCLWGGFGTSGQRCTAASRVIVHEQVYDAFVEEFVRRVKALRVGDGLDPAVHMGPVVSEGQLATVRSTSRSAAAKVRSCSRAAIGSPAAPTPRLLPRADHLRRRRARRCASRRKRFSARSWR